MKTLPKINELKSMFVALKATIHDDYSTEGDEPGAPPSMSVTVGWTPEDGGWNFQTGDNSFTGGAYGHPLWAVVYLTRRANSTELAREVRSQLLDQYCQ